MKYSKSKPPIQCLMKNSTCYKGSEVMDVKGVLWHSTGANNKTIKRYVQPSDNDTNKLALLKLIGTNTNGNDWNHTAHQAGVNAWIGELADGTVAAVRTLPDNMAPWGCGSGNKGSCNYSHYQFEICEDGLNDKTYFDKVYKEACELTAYICSLYNINPKGSIKVNGVTCPTILCHVDSYNLGLGTGHADVMHWFKKYNKTMDDVRNDVYELLHPTTSTTVTTTSSSSSTATTSDEQTIWNYLYSKIGNAYGVAGLMGNLYAESGLSPKNLQDSYEGSLKYTDDTYTTAVDKKKYKKFVKDGAGYGLAQWTYYTRKQSLLNYAQSKNVSVGDLNMQLEFLYNELSNSYSSVLKSLKSATSVKAASDAVLTGFEKPTIQNTEVKNLRAKYGNTYYSKYAKNNTTKTTTSSLYKVYSGGYKLQASADKQIKRLAEKNFKGIIVETNGMYKVQIGAYSSKENAENMKVQLIHAGFVAVIKQE